LPLLLWISNHIQNPEPDERPLTAKLGAFLTDNFVLLFLPSAILQGFVHGRALAHLSHFRWHGPVPRKSWAGRSLPALGRVALLCILPSLAACFLLSQEGAAIGLANVLLPAGELLGF